MYDGGTCEGNLVAIIIAHESRRAMILSINAS